MKKHLIAAAKAIRHIQVADYMLTMTYPLIKESRILYSVIENIQKGLNQAILSILYWERLYKRIPPIPEQFLDRLELFKQRCVEKYLIDSKNIELIKEVQMIVKLHKNASVTFTRKNRFVICSDNYNYKALSVDEIKEKLSKAKLFIEQTSSIIEKNERLFGRRA